MFKIIVDNIFVKKYEQNMFGGGVVHFTDNEREAGKFPEIIAREICGGLRSLGKDTMMKRYNDKESKKRRLNCYE